MKDLEELIREAIIESCDRFGHSIPTQDIDEIAKEKIDEFINSKRETISDGYNTYGKRCVKCGHKTMQIVRPGKVQCTNCE